jgi:hypothetical protein
VLRSAFRSLVALIGVRDHSEDAFDEYSGTLAVGIAGLEGVTLRRFEPGVGVKSLCPCFFLGVIVLPDGF